MPGPTPARSVSVAVLLVALAGAGSCVIESDTADPPTTSSTSTVPRGDRHSRLDVGSDSTHHYIEFADAHTGFALFQAYGSPRQAALFRTDDAGRSWQRLPFEAGGRSVHGLTTTTPADVAISTEGGYVVSRDGGRSFAAAEDFPAHMRAPLDRRAGLRCRDKDDDGDCLRYEVAKGERFVPQQPALRDDVESVAEDTAGRIWAVAFAQDGVFTAASADQGSTWAAVPDLQLPYRVDRARLFDAREDGDLWLLVDGRDGELSAYLADGGSWRPVADTVRPGFDTKLVERAGGGVLALAGKGFGYLGRDGTWRPADAPSAVQTLSRLADGTLTAEPEALTAGVWIGTGQGAERVWAHVTVEGY